MHSSSTSVTYITLMIVSALSGFVLMILLGEKSKLKIGQRIAIGLGAFCGAMIGAKLPFVLSDLEGLKSGAVWFSNGKTIMFGFVGGYVGVEFVKLALHIRVKTGDSFAVPVAVAVGIGRLGCYHAGCCFGQPTALPWGKAFPLSGDHLLRHPAQLYELIFHFGAAAVIFFLLKRNLLRGQLIKLYILAYMAYRFLSEWLRPEPSILLGLTFYQWSAIGISLVFVQLWRKDAYRFRVQADHAPPMT